MANQARFLPLRAAYPLVKYINVISTLISNSWRVAKNHRLGVQLTMLCQCLNVTLPRPSQRNRCSIFHTHHRSLYTLEMNPSSNVIIHGGTFNSAQGDFHIHNRNSESGMHDFKSVQKSILIDDSMKDFTFWDKEFLLVRFMTRQNATLRQIVILIPARSFDGLF